MNVPHADLMQRIENGLAGIQARLDVLDAQLADLCTQGVFLDPEGNAVVPGWSPRRENGRHVAWVLVWPTAYARAMGISRRKYVSKKDEDAMRDQTGRTQDYARLREERDRLANDLRATGADLQNIIRWRQW